MRKQIIQTHHITEKTNVLGNLMHSTSNKCVARCNCSQIVFRVHPDSNKQEIKREVENLYKEKGIQVKSVNTINCKPKKRRVRGRKGKTSGWKKAIVTLKEGQTLDVGV